MGMVAVCGRQDGTNYKHTLIFTLIFTKWCFNELIFIIRSIVIKDQKQ